MDWTAPQILVIASEPTVRFTIEELLRAYGYDVTTAPSRAAASHIDTEGRFAAMVVDPTFVSMPLADQAPLARVKPDHELEYSTVGECLPV